MGKRVKGIEPSCPAWEAGVLPLNYTRNAIADFGLWIAETGFARTGLLPGNDVIPVSAGVLVGCGSRRALRQGVPPE